MAAVSGSTAALTCAAFILHQPTDYNIPFGYHFFFSVHQRSFRWNHRPVQAASEAEQYFPVLPPRREKRISPATVPLGYLPPRHRVQPQLPPLQANLLHQRRREMQKMRAPLLHGVRYAAEVHVDRDFHRQIKSILHDRAPKIWMNPTLPTCRFCEQKNGVKPIIADKKKSINCLFLGCCTFEQLKYFCKHTKNHRTCTKDRMLYLTYLGLCKQLDPNDR